MKPTRWIVSGLILCFWVPACVVDDATQNADSDFRVVGGQSVTTDEYPFVAAIFQGGVAKADLLCSGTLVASRWVLTAAHCVDQIRANQLGQLHVGVGRRLLGQYNAGNTQGVNKIFVHPDFDPHSFDHDVALLRLDATVPQALPQLLSLTQEGDWAAPGSSVRTLGFGRTSQDGNTSNSLQQGVLQVLSRPTCRSDYATSWVTNEMLCAERPVGGRGMCQGDDGGPLLLKHGGTWRVAGVASWARGCGEVDQPGVYARVARHEAWITGCIADAASCVRAAPSTCRPRVVVTGYWPPTNDMLRPWSTNPAQNPSAWEGENWRGLGYDVYAYFPEFPPDNFPFDDPFGSAGFIGSPGSDLRVDYQDTSADFWDIVDTHDPVVLVTTSRGSTIPWELESVEGGHGAGSASTLAHTDWLGDGNGVTQPTQTTVDARSWDAISAYRTTTLGSALPLTRIRSGVEALFPGMAQIDDGTSGNYLSGFMALHGLYYHQQHRNNLAAGHIHVGTTVTVPTARALFETSLQTILERHPSATAPCSDAGD